MQRATIDDVAALAGVSIKTVSRVVNREPNVSDATRAKVERAIAELNYHPNLSARNLASQRARLIALIYDDPASYENASFGYVIRMQTGALSACRTADYRLVIYPCDYSQDDYRRRAAGDARTRAATGRRAGRAFVEHAADSARDHRDRDTDGPSFAGYTGRQTVLGGNQ